IPTVGDYVTPSLVGGSQGKMVANLIQVQFGPANNWPLGATLSLVAMASVGFVAILFVILATALGRRIR
ncbi:ABC transporter permease, partial [Leisingera sp. McT4-56]|nr:ABC transporter permease [Leisingera sp. McT4-56]